jgi:hypothetical protein
MKPTPVMPHTQPISAMKPVNQARSGPLIRLIHW